MLCGPKDQLQASQIEPESEEGRVSQSQARRRGGAEKKGTAAAAADDDDDVHSYHEYDRLFSFRMIVQFRQ